MATAVIRTDLSVFWTDDETGQERYVYHMGAPSVATFSFAVATDGDGLPVSATATMARVDTRSDVTAETIDATDVDGENVLVTVSGLTRGLTYELTFTATYANGRKAPQTFVIDCVA